MLCLVYTLLCTLILFFILLKKKNISLAVVYFLSSCIYYYNAFAGKIFVGKMSEVTADSYSMQTGTYIVLTINLLAVLFALSLERDLPGKMDKREMVGEEFVMKFAFCGTLSLAVFLCIQYGVFSRISFNKTELMESSTHFVSYYKYMASFMFVYVFTEKNIRFSVPWKLVATVPILTTFLFGNRSFIVISILALLFDYIYKKCLNSRKMFFGFLMNHKKIIFLFFGLLAIVLAVKGVTSALFSSNYTLVISRLTNIDYYLQAFRVSEPNQIAMNLDTIVANDYRILGNTYMTLWAYFIPLLTGRLESMLGQQSFSAAYQSDLYSLSGSKANRASTMLGEAYANGGYMMVFIVSLFYMILLYLIFRGYRNCKTNVAATCFLLMGIDASFYTHRNSMAYEFSRLRDYVYIALILFALVMLVTLDYRLSFKSTKRRRKLGMRK